jgi:hypothetical protein
MVSRMCVVSAALVFGAAPDTRSSSRRAHGMTPSPAGTCPTVSLTLTSATPSEYNSAEERKTETRVQRRVPDRELRPNQHRSNQHRRRPTPAAARHIGALEREGTCEADGLAVVVARFPVRPAVRHELA